MWLRDLVVDCGAVHATNPADGGGDQKLLGSYCCFA